MGTAGTEDRRPDRQLRRLRTGDGFRALQVRSEERVERGADRVSGVLAGGGDVVAEFAVYLRLQTMFSAEVGQFLFDDRVEFFEDQDFIEVF